MTYAIYDGAMWRMDGGAFAASFREPITAERTPPSDVATMLVGYALAAHLEIERAKLARFLHRRCRARSRCGARPLIVEGHVFDAQLVAFALEVVAGRTADGRAPKHLSIAVVTHVPSLHPEGAVLVMRRGRDAIAMVCSILPPPPGSEGWPAALPELEVERLGWRWPDSAPFVDPAEAVIAALVKHCGYPKPRRKRTPRRAAVKAAHARP